VSEDEDRIGALPDDVLLVILDCLDVRMAVQTSVLSTRWRHLHHLLPYLVINVEHFRDGRRTVDQVMAAYTDVTRRLLSLPTCQCIRTIKTLQLYFYLADPYLSSLARVVGDAVSNGVTEYLEFALYGCIQCPTEAQLALFGQRFMSFFHACPGAFNLLTKLTLQNLSFQDSDSLMSPISSAPAINFRFSP
jgi:hypothetical protein